MRTFAISKGQGYLPKVVRHTVEWHQLVKRLSQHKQLDVKKKGDHFVGGTFKTDYREDENVEIRSLLTIDIDHYDGAYEDLLFEFSLSAPCAFVLYSTFQSAPDDPRVRAVIPLSRDITGEEYRILSRAFCSNLEMPIDPASYTPSQLMWLPASPDGTGWSYSSDGDYLDVEAFLSGYVAPAPIDDEDGFEVALTNHPIDISDEEVDAYLEAYEAEGLDYDLWAEVGMALAHQYQQSQEGYAKWVEWSALSSKHDPHEMRNKWKSFKGARKPVKFSTIIHRAKSLRVTTPQSEPEEDGEVTPEARQSFFDKMNLAASNVNSVDSWDRFKKKLNTISTVILPDDFRGILAHEVYEGFGKKAGLTKKLIKDAIRYKRSEREAKGEMVYEADLPHMKDGMVIQHYQNLEAILKKLEVVARYDVIKKEEVILIPGQSFSIDNQANNSLAWVISECSLFDFPTSKVPEFLSLIADKNRFNPVVTWVESKPWDGISRLEDFYATVTCETEEQDYTKKIFMKRWMVSAIAAAYTTEGFTSRGMLVFQGDQNIGKTHWFRNLVPHHLGLTKDGYILRPDNKDSVLSACSNWLVELGELDATFKKADIASLKAFISTKKDVVRRPYARKDSHYERRTVFFGSVNDDRFLNDTANSRYWVVPVITVDHSHNLDMQQVWAEFKLLFDAGESPYLLEDENHLLAESNETFKTICPIEERIFSGLAWSAPKDRWRWAQSTDILRDLGINDPSRSQAQQCGYALKKKNIHKNRRSGGYAYLVPPCGSDGFDDIEDEL